MARRIGATCRLCRTEGEKLFLKGTRCIADKCAVVKRQYSPGQHGATKRRKKLSNYALQLRQKQKVKKIYGLLEKQFRNYFIKADKAKGVTGEVLLQFLERRLDNVIFRACFAESRSKARQMVRHRFVKVNGRRVDIPSFLVKVGDTVEITGKENQKKAVSETIKIVADRGTPEWMDVSEDKLVSNIVRLPVKSDIGMDIEENLIVELYSK